MLTWSITFLLLFAAQPHSCDLHPPTQAPTGDSHFRLLAKPPGGSPGFTLAEARITVRAPGEYIVQAGQRRLLVVEGEAVVDKNGIVVRASGGSSVSLDGDPVVERLGMRRLVF